MSTNMALIDLIEDISSAIEKKKFTIGIFIDLKKAFDTINHKILLKKLHHYGICGIVAKWIENYLLDREQFVNYNGYESNKMFIKCGVPQGSILGPLLFIIYINDMSSTSDVLKFILFADDTNIFFSSSNLKHAQDVMNTELINLSEWFKVNKLSLNIMKTNYIVFTSTHNKVSIPVHLAIDHMYITRVKFTKFLGVFIDENLNWNKHIEEIEKKVSKSIGIMYRVKDKLDEKSMFNLYCTLVLPYLQYCNVIWGINYKNKLNNINVLQKKAIRIVNKSEYRCHTNPLFYKWKTLTFNDLVNLNTYMVLFKARQNLLPANINNIFEIVQNVHHYKTRQSTDFQHNKFKTTAKMHTIKIHGPILWSKLPSQIKDCSTIFSFKKKVKSYLLEQYNI